MGANANGHGIAMDLINLLHYILTKPLIDSLQVAMCYLMELTIQLISKSNSSPLFFFLSVFQIIIFKLPCVEYLFIQDEWMATLLIGLSSRYLQKKTIEVVRLNSPSVLRIRRAFENIRDY